MKLSARSEDGQEHCLILEVKRLGADSTIGLVTLKGRLSYHFASQVRNCFLSMIDEGVKRAIVDLSELTYVDMSGLGVFISLRKKMGQPFNDGRVTLVCTDENILKVFQVTGLERVFAISQNLEDATEDMG